MATSNKPESLQHLQVKKNLTAYFQTTESESRKHILSSLFRCVCDIATGSRNKSKHVFKSAFLAKIYPLGALRFFMPRKFKEDRKYFIVYRKT